MSAIEYNNLLFEASQRLEELNVRERLLFMCRGKLTSGSDGNIPDVLSLFRELEDKEYLGIDRLKILKEILKSVREWSLFGKVKNLERKRKEYNGLLEEIIRVLDELNDMERLMSLCRGKVPEENEGNIKNARRLLEELQNHEHLDVDQLDILKEILTRTEKKDLLLKVNEFEKRMNEEEELESRKARASAVVSSARAVGERLIGEVRMHCTFRKISGALLVVGTGVILHKCSKLEDFVEAFTAAVLPAASALQTISEGSVCFTVQLQKKSAVKALWNRYLDGTLQRDLQQFLVTDEIKQLAGGEEVMINVYIDEQELKNANSDLSTADCQERDGPDGMSSRNDRRRNSDSSLYCKQREGDEMGDSAKKSESMPANFLDTDKAAYVQSYLDSVHDVNSITTDISDSAFGTGPESEPGSEETGADFRFKVCLKDLSHNVTCELTKVLGNDPEIKKNVFQAFGLKFEPNERGLRMKIFDLFPDTPVKLLKEVFEALQLYDLAELLEKDKPRSLRSALPLEEIKKLRQCSDRPTVFHSQVAVLIIDDAKENASVKNIISFFKDLSSDSKTDVVSLESLQKAMKITGELEERKLFEKQWNRRWKNLKAMKEDFEERIKNKEFPLRRRRLFRDPYFFSRAEESEVEGAEEVKLQEEIKEKEKLVKDELKNVEEAISSIMDVWIHDQDHFTFFVVMESSDLYKFPDISAMIENCLAKKLELIPSRMKFVIGSQNWDRLKHLPELLQVICYCSSSHFVVLMDEVINKRWQTLDIISMIKEIERNLLLKKSSPFREHELSLIDDVNLEIKDNLSLVPKFRKKQGYDSAS
ncbi:uncharacterized protein LOC111329179 [Stylophora pistillata]|uniref:DED domain-containing protein n=1 Tax=Stylophora pistillata TaxID=50429 RepID=A0A2B4SCK5_STYPI|nr:uncharacterized protein LOC111329179 [Stylophora pistillata]PFX26307.1 hypothetical protein AWC38_SpisGene9038 [Stylophora pistillata]